MTVRMDRPTTAWRLDVAVLRTLAERLPAGEAALLADALPPLLGLAARPERQVTQRFDAAEVLRRVRDRAGLAGVPDAVTRREVSTALHRIAGYCPAAVLYRVQLPLPDDIRGLFPKAVRLGAAGSG